MAQRVHDEAGWRDQPVGKVALNSELTDTCISWLQRWRWYVQKDKDYTKQWAKFHSCMITKKIFESKRAETF